MTGLKNMRNSTLYVRIDMPRPGLLLQTTQILSHSIASGIRNHAVGSITAAIIPLPVLGSEGYVKKSSFPPGRLLTFLIYKDCTKHSGECPKNYN